MMECVLGMAAGGEAWLEVFGRLHVLVLHFPIALLIAAGVVELVRAIGRKGTIAGATIVCLVLGTLGGALTAVTGWYHAPFEFGSGPDDLTLGLHRWLGIAGASIGGLATILALITMGVERRALVAWTRVVVLVGAITIGVAGHFGGSLTHESGYVLAPLRPTPTRIAQAPVEQSPGDDGPDGGGQTNGTPVIAEVDFTTDVRPILEGNCFRCHGPDRQRGGLRLDDMDELKTVITPGDPDNSHLLEVLRLPEDDELHMPHNKPSLPDEQISLIAAWVGSLAAADSTAPAEPGEQVNEAPSVGASANDDPVAENFEPPASAPMPVLDEGEIAARDAAIKRLRESGFVASIIAANEDAVEVRIAGDPKRVTDESLSLLEGLEPALVILDLNAGSISDAGLERVARFAHLRRLRLGETGVTDAGLANLAALSELESLDLHMTGVTDVGVDALLELGRLRSLYLWQTGVTHTGAARLRAAMPWIDVDLGTP